jgi:hypothetical protein
MEAPSSSAMIVATAASMAEPSMARDSQGLSWRVAASERQSPVTMPRWAALCCRRISMRVERVTIQSSL